MDQFTGWKTEPAQAILRTLTRTAAKVDLSRLSDSVSRRPAGVKPPG
jgi:hypothetical protein